MIDITKLETNLKAIAEHDQTPEHIAETIATLKDVETLANRLRLESEKKFLVTLGEIDAEGTTNIEAGAFKVTVRCSVTRSVDAKALAEIAPQIPEPIAKRLFRWKPELDTRELRYLQNNEVELYGVVAQAITTKAAKPSISVERREG